MAATAMTRDTRRRPDEIRVGCRYRCRCSCGTVMRVSAPPVKRKRVRRCFKVISCLYPTAEVFLLPQFRRWSTLSPSRWAGGMCSNRLTGQNKDSDATDELPRGRKSRPASNVFNRMCQTTRSNKSANIPAASWNPRLTFLFAAAATARGECGAARIVQGRAADGRAGV